MGGAQAVPAGAIRLCAGCVGTGRACEAAACVTAGMGQAFMKDCGHVESLGWNQHIESTLDLSCCV